MRRTRRNPVLMLILLTGLSLGLANQAYALSVIPFYATNEEIDAVCIEVDGPWFRTSGQVLISPQVTNVNFYYAEINLFSPYGEWKFNLFFPDSRGLCEKGLGDYSGSYVRCTVSESDQWLSLSYGSAGFQVAGASCRPTSAIAAAATADPVTAVAAAFLGHDEPAAQTGGPARGKAPRGSDHFRFAGRAGDAVELVLDRDGARGSVGEIARLSLRGKAGVLGKRQGAVPLRLKATLPAAGHYEIEVAEAESGVGREPFRGHYHLRVTSGSGTAILLEPLRSVEP